MSSSPGRSKLAALAQLGREAAAAAAGGRWDAAVALFEEMVRLDPGDRRTLHRLGDLYRIRFGRLREAAECYAGEARGEERDGFEAKALAAWRLVVRCDPRHLEAHQRIGGLLVSLNRLADARAHYERTARELESAGLGQAAATLRERLAELRDHVLVKPEIVSRVPYATAAEATGRSDGSEQEAPGASVAAEAAAGSCLDDNAADLAADRFQNGRLFHHYGLHQQARKELEHLLASVPSHVEGRRILVEVCRALDDQEAAAEHMRVLTRLMREQGTAATPARAPVAWQEPEIEEWIGMEEPAAPADPMAELIEEIREDVEAVVSLLKSKEGWK